VKAGALLGPWETSRVNHLLAAQIIGHQAISTLGRSTDG
jgi:hypothetical protein